MDNNPSKCEEMRKKSKISFNDPFLRAFGPAVKVFTRTCVQDVFIWKYCAKKSTLLHVQNQTILTIDLYVNDITYLAGCLFQYNFIKSALLYASIGNFQFGSR